MTAESVYRSALILMGESPDSTAFSEAALSALSLIVAELTPLRDAYHAAYGQPTAGEASCIGCLCEELPLPTVLFPATVYALTAMLCRDHNPDYAAVLEEKYRALCQSLWEVLPAKVHPVQDSYPE